MIIRYHTSGKLLQSLKEGRLDLVFVENENIDPLLWSYELFTESYYVLFPLDHKCKSQETVDFIELSKDPLITHQAPCDTRNHIVNQMELAGYKPNIVNEVAFGDFIYDAVATGMGITIVPELLAKNIHHLHLFALPIVNFGRKRTISLVSKDKKLGSMVYEHVK